MNSETHTDVHCTQMFKRENLESSKQERSELPHTKDPQ